MLRAGGSPSQKIHIFHSVLRRSLLCRDLRSLLFSYPDAAYPKLFTFSERPASRFCFRILFSILCAPSIFPCAHRRFKSLVPSRFSAVVFSVHVVNSLGSEKLLKFYKKGIFFRQKQLRKSKEIGKILLNFQFMYIIVISSDWNYIKSIHKGSARLCGAACQTDHVHAPRKQKPRSGVGFMQESSHLF